MLLELEDVAEDAEAGAVSGSRALLAPDNTASPGADASVLGRLEDGDDTISTSTPVTSARLECGRLRERVAAGDPDEEEGPSCCCSCTAVWANIHRNVLLCGPASSSRGFTLRASSESVTPPIGVRAAAPSVLLVCIMPVGEAMEPIVGSPCTDERRLYRNRCICILPTKLIILVSKRIC
jgi:hypothetical protein